VEDGRGKGGKRASWSARGDENTKNPIQSTSPFHKKAPGAHMGEKRPSRAREKTQVRRREKKKRPELFFFFLFLCGFPLRLCLKGKGGKGGKKEEGKERGRRSQGKSHSPPPSLLSKGLLRVAFVTEGDGDAVPLKRDFPAQSHYCLRERTEKDVWDLMEKDVLRARNDLKYRQSFLCPLYISS
jgi:hypothetical protein